MEVYWKSSWLIVLLGVTLLTTTLQGVQGEVEVAEGPSESECRPYVERALKELETVEPGVSQTPDVESSKEDLSTVEISNDDSDQKLTDGDDDADDRKTSNETNEENESQESTEDAEPTKEIEDTESQEKADSTGDNIVGDIPAETAIGNDGDQVEDKNDSGDSKAEEDSKSLESSEEGKALSVEDQNDTVEEFVQKEGENETNAGSEGDDDTQESNDTRETEETVEESVENLKITPEESPKPVIEEESQETQETVDTSSETEEKVDVSNETHETHAESGEDTNSDSDQQVEGTDKESVESETDDDKNASGEKSSTDSNEGPDDDKTEELAKYNKEQLPADSKEDTTENTSTGASKEDETEPSKDTKDSNVDSNQQGEEVKIEIDDKNESKESSEDDSKPEGDTKDSDSEEGSESAPEEELMLEIDIPEDLRSRDHVEQLLKLDKDSSEAEEVVNRVSKITLKELKRLYENAIKPLEILYKYRDLSNRHFGDSEIFSKPLILFMGPWSGGKSSIINYLLDNEYNETSLRTGAEPSPAYFNILMHGNEPEILDGTQLAADHTFSGLQKFGQGLEERLRGVKLPSKLLEKVNVVEIPGILEVRKQVSRIFPFNDACQWFIDRADIIFLVYDPSKLDVGPETEAILDQLKGREHQTRIILNKADQVKPEELMRVQGALIWNISPLMSSAQPPVMYTTSLWSRPYESWAPVRLLQAQERAFLRDLRTAIEKRIDNKIASARRFAVRVRNHAKMVDCYLTTYYNHKSVFGNRKQVADQIIEHPQDYHIYEGLSTLTNISRYDLPDPDVYKDFFRLNPLYEFQQLSATCTYFRGCPINRLDIAIAYDLPELVGKHKRLVETALTESHQGPAKVPGS